MTRRANIAWTVAAALLFCLFLVNEYLQEGRLTTGSSHRQRQAEIATASIGNDMLAEYKAHRGHYPSTDEGLKALYPNYSSSKDLRDPWGHPYVYSLTVGGARPFLLYSIGENGLDENGRGDDIEYWSLRK